MKKPLRAARLTQAALRREQMWRTLRFSRSGIFTPQLLALEASTRCAPVAPRQAREYLEKLASAGHCGRVGDDAPTACWRIAAASKDVVEAPNPRRRKARTEDNPHA
jgi:hypothetical protein